MAKGRKYVRKTDREYPGAARRDGKHYKDNICKAMKLKPNLLMGTLISIDPSSGSEASMPAVAVFVKGELVYTESLYIAPGKALCYRLSRLLAELLAIKSKWDPDAVAVEWIPQKINGSAIPALRSAIGVISAVFGERIDKFVEVPAQAWKSLAQRKAKEAYIKSDIADAIGIGLWIFEAAGIEKDFASIYAELNRKLEEDLPPVKMQDTARRIKTKRAIAVALDFDGGAAAESEEIVFLS